MTRWKISYMKTKLNITIIKERPLKQTGIKKQKRRRGFQLKVLRRIRMIIEAVVLFCALRSVSIAQTSKMSILLTPAAVVAFDYASLIVVFYEKIFLIKSELSNLSLCRSFSSFKQYMFILKYLRESTFWEHILRMLFNFGECGIWMISSNCTIMSKSCKLNLSK